MSGNINNQLPDLSPTFSVQATSTDKSSLDLQIKTPQKTLSRKVGSRDLTKPRTNSLPVARTAQFWMSEGTPATSAKEKQLIELGVQESIGNAVAQANSSFKKAPLSQSSPKLIDPREQQVRMEEQKLAQSKELDKLLNKDSKTKTLFDELNSTVKQEREKYDKMPRDKMGGPKLFGEDKEKFQRFETLEKKLNENPLSVAKEIQEFRDKKLFKHLGSYNFTSYLAQSDLNLEKNPTAKSLNLNPMERVAIYGYTTEDYKALNKAMREAKGKALPDDGMQKYMETAIKGMKKILDMPTPLVLKRALFEMQNPEEWIKENLIYKDHAFSSAAKENIGGTISLTFEFDDNKPTHVKDLGPFSAQPGEHEIVIMPGTSFNQISRDLIQRTVTYSNR